MKFYFNRRTDPYYNLALEEYLSKNLTEDFFMLWQNDNAVIVGKNQITAAEINSDYIQEKHISVVRRITGGGAVYHDLGNINYTVGTSQRLLNPDAFRIHAAPIVQALRRMGIQAEFSGRNDLLCQGRKFSGAARSLFRQRTLFHGTLLFDTDLSVLGKALRPDPEKILAKGIRSVQSRVINLKECLPDYSMEQFIEEFSRNMKQELKAGQIDEIPAEAVRQAEKSADEKYRLWSWNYGNAIPYDFKKKKHFAGGTLEVRYTVNQSRIQGLKISGDFFYEKNIEELEEAVNGSSPDPACIQNRISGINLNQYLQGITAEEFLSLFT